MVKRKVPTDKASSIHGSKIYGSKIGSNFLLNQQLKAAIVVDNGYHSDEVSRIW